MATTSNFVTIHNKEVIRTWNINHIVCIRDNEWIGTAFRRYEVVLSNGIVEVLTEQEYDKLMSSINNA